MKLHQFVVVLIAALLSAGTILAVKKVTVTLDPFAIAFLRYSVAALFLVPWVNFKERSNISSKTIPQLLIIGVVGLFISEYLYLTAYKSACAIDCALIMATNPIFTLIAAAIFLGEHITFTKACAFIISLIGAALVIVDGNFSVASFRADWGELLMLGASLAWVAYNIVLKQLCKTFSPLFIVFCATVIGALCFAPFMINQQIIAPLFAMDIWTILALGYITILATAIGYPLYSYLVKTLGPSTTSFLMYSLVPLFLALLAPLFLADEKINLYHFVGGALIIGALALNVYASRRAA